MGKFVNETKCHRLEIEPRNLYGIRVVESRGLEYIGEEKLVCSDEKIDIRRHFYQCRTCREELFFDSARAILT